MYQPAHVRRVSRPKSARVRRLPTRMSSARGPARAEDRVDGEAGHREALRQVFRREAQVNIFAEPRKRDAHEVLELLQYPQVVLIEVAHVRHAV